MLARKEGKILNRLIKEHYTWVSTFDLLGYINKFLLNHMVTYREIVLSPKCIVTQKREFF